MCQDHNSIYVYIECIIFSRSEYNASEWTMYIVHGWGPDRQNGSRFWITDIVNDLLKLEVSGCDAFMKVYTLYSE